MNIWKQVIFADNRRTNEFQIFKDFNFAEINLHENVLKFGIRENKSSRNSRELILENKSTRKLILANINTRENISI